MTDNRTNEMKPNKAKSSQDFVFTEAQVEAAAKIIRRASLETTADPGDFWSDCYEGEQEAWRDAARAALVAAQGAAPPLPSSVRREVRAVAYKCCKCCEMPGGNDPEIHSLEGADWHEIGCSVCNDYRLAGKEKNDE